MRELDQFDPLIERLCHWAQLPRHRRKVALLGIRVHSSE
jgi:hypothetical protein